MSEKVLSKEQKIAVLKQEWLQEAKPYLENGTAQKDYPHLDGTDSAALAKIQEKYKAKMRELERKHRIE